MMPVTDPTETLHQCIEKLISTDTANSTGILYEDRLFLPRLMVPVDFPDGATLRLVPGKTLSHGYALCILRFQSKSHLPKWDGVRQIRCF